MRKRKPTRSESKTLYFIIIIYYIITIFDNFLLVFLPNLVIVNIRKKLVEFFSILKTYNNEIKLCLKIYAIYIFGDL